jgi:hypothetical protein
LAKTVRFRPQVGFIKAIEPKGTIMPEPSISEQLARAIFEKQQQEASSN